MGRTLTNETDVAQEFGVSRTPVREAFRTLLAEVCWT
ncbi:GntR family transcriptional regulator [Acidovorax sp. JG5]|nr:GntR family transcriptional regulator [Acidovorax sp. JG5]